MSPPESKIDVLIIGAGPAGLFAAHGLAQAGVAVRIIDQLPEGVLAGQADGVSPRTIEVLQNYGLAERLARASKFTWLPDGGIEVITLKSCSTPFSAFWIGFHL